MSRFDFKQFSVDDTGCAMKVGTDSVLLGAWANMDGVKSVLDVGAGSGLLALMAAQRCPDAKITAIEKDPDAYRQALKNVESSPWADRIEVIRCDICDYWTDDRFDLIICNPPYFVDSLKSPDQSRNTARHVASGNSDTRHGNRLADPKLSKYLNSLNPVTCVEIACQLISNKGTLAMITPMDYEDVVTYYTEMYSGLKIWRRDLVCPVYGRKFTRILWQIAVWTNLRLECDIVPIKIAGYDEYHPKYKKLTKDFYLHL